MLPAPMQHVNDPLEFLLFVCFEFKRTCVCCEVWQSCGQRRTSLKRWLVYFLNEVSPSMLVHTQRELFNSARLVSCTVANVVFAVLVPPLSPFFIQVFYFPPFFNKIVQMARMPLQQTGKITGITKCRPMQTIIHYLAVEFWEAFCHCMLDYVFWQASQSSICLVTCICCCDCMVFVKMWRRIDSTQAGIEGGEKIRGITCLKISWFCDNFTGSAH